MFPTITNQVTKAAPSRAATAFLSSLVRLQHSLYKKETADFVYAREAALSIISPNRFDLLQIYRDIDTDLFIRGQINQRIGRIKNRKIKVVNKTTGETDEKLTKLLHKKWFREFKRYVMEAKVYGFSLVYFGKDANGNPVTKLVWREHVIPEHGLVVKNPYDTEGVSFLEGPLAQATIAIGDPESLGMYENLAYAYILRKHSWASWDEFEELFGVPLRWATTDASSTEVLDELEGFLNNMGASNYAIAPRGATLDVKDGNTQDAFGVFNEKRKAVNEEVSIFIHGNAEQINEKGSRGKSETIIANTQAEILDDDKEDCLTVINDDLLPFLTRVFNYHFNENHECQWDDTTQLPPKERAEIYKVVSDMGFELDEEQLSAELDVKIVGKKETINPEPKKSKAKKEDEDDEDDKPTNVLDAINALAQLHVEVNKLYHNV